MQTKLKYQKVELQYIKQHIYSRTSIAMNTLC